MEVGYQAVEIITTLPLDRLDFNLRMETNDWGVLLLELVGAQNVVMICAVRISPNVNVSILEGSEDLDLVLRSASNH